MKQHLTLQQMWSAPAHVIMADMRRAALLRRISNDQYPTIKDVAYVTSELHMILEEAHVFDIGQLLDETHSSYIGQELCQSLYEQGKNDMANRTMRVPFGNMVFLLRAYDPDTTNGYIEVMNVGQSDETGDLFAGAWVYTTKGNWSLAYIFVITNDEVRGPLPAHLDEAKAHDARMMNACMLLACIEMINRQGQATELATVPQPTFLHPKAFERPHPSMRVLRVCKPELLKLPRDYSPPSTDRHQSPHDRRGHWATSKKGLKFWRNACKVNGGAVAPVTTVVKLANCQEPVPAAPPRDCAARSALRAERASHACPTPTQAPNRGSQDTVCHPATPRPSCNPASIAHETASVFLQPSS